MSGFRKRDRATLIRLRGELGDVSFSEALAKLERPRKLGAPKRQWDTLDEYIYFAMQAISQQTGIGATRAWQILSRHLGKRFPYEKTGLRFTEYTVEKMYERGMKRAKTQYSPAEVKAICDDSKFFGSLLKKIERTAKTRAI